MLLFWLEFSYHAMISFHKTCDAYSFFASTWFRWKWVRLNQILWSKRVSGENILWIGWMNSLNPCLNRSKLNQKLCFFTVFQWDHRILPVMAPIKHRNKLDLTKCVAHRFVEKALSTGQRYVFIKSRRLSTHKKWKK